MILSCNWTLDHTLQLISIFVDALAAGGAIAAIFIALKANKQNRTEIAQAQAEIANSIKIQEQSKNIELFNQRIELLNKTKELQLPDYDLDYRIKEKKAILPSYSKEELIILFNNDPIIMQLYNGLLVKIKKQETNISSLIHFSEHYFLLIDGGCPVNEVMSKIMEYENILSAPDCPENILDDMQEYVEKYAFSEENPVTKEAEEYDYISITSIISSIEKEFNDDKKSLIDKMRIFIDESIKPIKEM